MPSQNHRPTDAGDKACDCAEKKRKDSIILGVTAAPPSLQRFFFNNRCPMAVKGIGHMLLFTIAIQLSATSTTNERVKTSFYAWKNGFLFLSAFIFKLYHSFFFHFVPSRRFALIFFFPILIPRGAIKEHKVTVFGWELSWNAKWAILLETQAEPTTFCLMACPGTI